MFPSPQNRIEMDYWNADKVESQNKKRAGIITLLVNILLLIAIYFIVVWKQPIPPLPTFGLELNLGFTPSGSGDISSSNPPSETQTPVVEAAAPGEVAQKSQSRSYRPNSRTQRPSKPNQSQTLSLPPIRRYRPSLLLSKGKRKLLKQSKNQILNLPNQQKPSPLQLNQRLKRQFRKLPNSQKINERALMGAGGNQRKRKPSCGWWYPR